MGPPKPQKVRKGSEITWAGQQLHKTHNLAHRKGIIICFQCGAYSQGARVRYLVDECQGRPHSASMGYALKMFRMGNHPFGPRGVWPQREAED